MKKFFGKGKKSKKTQKPVAETPAPTAPVAEPEPVAVPEEEVRDEVPEEPEVEAKPSKDETTDDAEKVEEDEAATVAKSKSGDAEDETSVEKASSGDVEEEEAEEEDENKLHIKRINTLHAEVSVPLSANSGDVLDIEHDGNKQIVVPSGQRGQSIVVKMVNSQKESEPDTGVFCGCL